MMWLLHEWERRVRLDFLSHFFLTGLRGWSEIISIITLEIKKSIFIVVGADQRFPLFTGEEIPL